MADKKKVFTLIEVMFAVAMAALIIIPSFQVIAGAMQAFDEKRKIFSATCYSKELMEEIRLKRFEESLGTTVLGRDTGETASRTTWDDVDDYNNYNETVIRDIRGTSFDVSFFRRVTVVYVNDKDLITVSATPTATKLVTVSCFYINDLNPYAVISAVFKR